MTFPQLISPILGFVSIIIGGWLTYRSTLQAKQMEAEATPYEKLSDRVGMLESQVETLMSERWTDRTFIRAVLDKWPAGRPYPSDVPMWARAIGTRGATVNTDDPFPDADWHFPRPPDG